MTEGGSRTGTKSWYTLRDMFVNEKCFRSSDAAGIGSVLGKDPELGVNKGARRDRTHEGLLKWDWNTHGQVAILRFLSKSRSKTGVRSTHEYVASTRLDRKSLFSLVRLFDLRVHSSTG